jgi:Amt family ammonium transporter
MASDRTSSRDPKPSDAKSDLAHELRTPITAILGYTNLLVEDFDGPPDRLEKLLVIRNHSEYLLRLVNHLLAPDAKGLPARRGPVDALAVAADVVALMRPVASAKRLSLAVESRSRLPTTVQSDELRLRQVLINLIGNALKFTNEGSVRVRVSFHCEPAPALRVEVVDTGVGMDAAQVAKLFQPFVQVHLSSRRRGGSGLGLSTSLRLVRQLGGELTVVSQPGLGTTFALSLPAPEVREADLAERTAEPPSEDAGPLAGLEFLLAAGGPDSRLLVSVALKRHGASVTLADDADAVCERALSASAAQRHFSAVLIGEDAPPGGAAKAASRLRAAGYSGTVFALGRQGGGAPATDPGLDAALTLPLEIDDLLAALRAVESPTRRKRV